MHNLKSFQSSKESIMLAVLISSMLMLGSSPLVAAVGLTITSIVLAVIMMKMGESMLVPSALVISFSTGMMVMFCYAASLSPSEKKIKKNFNALMISLVTLYLTCDYEAQYGTSLGSSPAWGGGLFISLVLIIILVAMMSINKSMYTKKMMMMLSY